jgi:hypothetical protein
MKKTIVLLTAAFALLISYSTMAQEYAVDMSSGKLILNEVDRIEIEGTTGSKVLISTESKKTEEDSRAKGLREISANGLKDNTGIGLSAEKSGSTVTINQVSRSSNRAYTVKVPKGVSVYYEHSSWEGKTLRISNLESELEVSANYNSVELNNVKGPMSVNTVYGQIDATFDQVSQSNAISLHSVYGNVDVSVPASAKASFTLKTSYGKIFSDLDLVMKSESNGMRSLSNSNITGSLNGGGVDFSIKATYKNVYLRKK